MFDIKTELMFSLYFREKFKLLKKLFIAKYYFTEVLSECLIDFTDKKNPFFSKEIDYSAILYGIDYFKAQQNSYLNISEEQNEELNSIFFKLSKIHFPNLLNEEDRIMAKKQRKKFIECFLKNDIDGIKVLQKKINHISVKNPLYDKNKLKDAQTYNDALDDAIKKLKDEIELLKDSKIYKLIEKEKNLESFFFKLKTVLNEMSVFGG